MPNWYWTLFAKFKPYIILDNHNIKSFAQRMTLNTAIMLYGIQESSVPAHTININKKYMPRLRERALISAFY